MQSEVFGNIFTEDTGNKMATGMDIGSLSEAKIAELAGMFKNSLVPPGHMPVDQARKYFSRIVTLFGKDETEVFFAVGGWACVHDVGGVQDFAGKPPIVCGTVEIPAVAVFGSIVPVSVAGEPRQFCATMFEEHIDIILKVFPQLKQLLAKRCAEAGLAGSDPKSVISFVKGVTVATSGGAVNRAGAKDYLLKRNMLSATGGGAAVAARHTAANAVEEVMPSSGVSGLW